MMPLRGIHASSQRREHVGSSPRLAGQQQQQHPLCRPAVRRCRLITVCRYDLRKSANNVEQRRQRQLSPGTSAAERSLSQQQLQDAKATLVHQRAHTLCGASKGRLSHHLCLFLLTEQPSLIQVDSGLLASRIATLADALGLTQPDVAELLVRNGGLLDVLPLRLKSAAEALCIALGLSKHEALVMLATDLTVLDIPLLRLKQQLEALAELLQVSLALLAAMVAACPTLAKVEPPAVQIRWTNIQTLLQLNNTDLQQLLQNEPRLLMPSSQTLSLNHNALCQTLHVSPTTLNQWVLAAPMLLLAPAAQVRNRVEALADVLVQETSRLGIPDAAAAADSRSTSPAAAVYSATVAAPPTATAYVTSSMTDTSSEIQVGGSHRSSSNSWFCVVSNPAQFTAYISKDPRVLLLKPHEIQQRLAVVQQELCCGSDLLSWLVVQHPSYMVVEPGSVTSWLQDVRHLTQMSAQQAIRLALCPQVFITMSPEEVYASLTSLSQTLHLQHPETLRIAAQEPLLLQQHPATIAAALQQLLRLISDRRLCHQLVLELPDLLLQGHQLQHCMAAAAALLTLTYAQLAVMLIREASLWWVLVPRHMWPDTCQLGQQQQHQQQQQHSLQQQQQQQPAALSPATATAVATMSALLNCGLRSPAVMQQVAVLQPLLLKLGQEAVQCHAQQLLEVCKGCQQWQQQLQGMSPELLGKSILKIGVWKARMMFLQETGLASRVTLQEVVNMSRDEFERCFSLEYKQWKAAQQDQQPQQQQQQPDWHDLQQQQQGHWQQHLGFQQGSTQRHVNDLVSASEAFAAGWTHGSSNSSSHDGTHPSRLLESSSNSLSHVLSPSTVSGMPADSYLLPEYQQQQLDLQGDILQDIGAVGAEGEVYYYKDSAPERWETEHSTGSSSSSYDGSENASNTHLKQQQRRQAQRQRLQQQQDKQQPAFLHQPFMSKAEMQLLAVQHSALGLYGTWQGSLVQPVDACRSTKDAS